MKLTKDSKFLILLLFTFQCSETSVTTTRFQNIVQSKLTDCLLILKTRLILNSNSIPNLLQVVQIILHCNRYRMSITSFSAILAKLDFHGLFWIQWTKILRPSNNPSPGRLAKKQRIFNRKESWPIFSERQSISRVIFTKQNNPFSSLSLKFSSLITGARPMKCWTSIIILEGFEMKSSPLIIRICDCLKPYLNHSLIWME